MFFQNLYDKIRSSSFYEIKALTLYTRLTLSLGTLLILLATSASLAAPRITLNQLQLHNEPPATLPTLSGKHYATFALEFEQQVPLPNLFTLNDGQKLILDLPETDNRAAPPSLKQGGIIENLTIANNHHATRILFDLLRPLSYQLHQSENTLYLTLFEPRTASQTASPKITRINLSLEQEPLSSALQKIAQDAGQNLILNGEITGTTSIQLQQVHWRAAFELLIQQHQLQLEERDGVLLVSPPIPEPSTPATTAIPALPASLKTELIPLHYADAADLKQTLESNQKNPLLSEHGVLGIDERTNTLLIQDEAERMEQIRTLIKQLDTPSKQVLIESRIVIAANDFSSELGARLGVSHLEATQQQWGFSLSGSSEAANSALSGTTPVLDQRLSVNLPVAAAAGRVGLTLAKLSTGSLIDLELSAAQLEGKTEIVATPRIITSNGYEASIQQGVQIPYRSDTLSGGTDVSFKDAVMELKVTPQITPDHQIILTLQVKKDAVGGILCNNCEPSVDTREVKTRVMIGDGETLVIGGIYEERKTGAENRIPLLADLPIIGPLFKNRRETDGQGELLIFITPSILQPPTG
ncbi:MAG: type IV pilus secretin PilQ [Gammaproteobacteria bacterium]|nr:type IV pilus secretin PilQ [Gammaproteobacteria bacterium]MBT4607251.1 type IV pilus secretin PilQ [Thiotrichales bacterium]MBT3473193.1 type IV pilus secretin PilQ [Gammaproteobacteria bacterium]MBT3967769.1 type IV pilus secretin PilQ [Gammaproteobacteria bacterium]MBT4079214.1 type IV pilus secretin PilQ [Gammaproteobacteria bacterium]